MSAARLVPLLNWTSFAEPAGVAVPPPVVLTVSETPPAMLIQLLPSQYTIVFAMLE